MGFLTNGHMTLELSIQDMKLTGEVIITLFTSASTTHVIVRNGLKPEFCGVNKNDFIIDVSIIEEMITNKTSAIVSTYAFGVKYM